MSKGINIDRNPTVLNDFLMYLLNIKGYSYNSVIEYENDLRIFFDFIIKFKELNIDYSNFNVFIASNITNNDILSFLVYLNYHRNNCAYTRERKIAAIKLFFKWFYSNNPKIKKENPAKNIPTIEKCFRLPKYLSLDEAKKIQTIFNKDNCMDYIRNNTMITLFLCTGIRLSELIHININDINFEDNTIKILGKGNKERNVYLSNYCKQKILDYIEVRKKDNSSNEALFTSSLNKRISKSSIENICKQAYKLMGLEDKKYTVHTLRHTAATIIFESNNRDLLLLKEFLGHVTILSTEIYTHTYNDLAKEAVNNNPLNDYC